MTELLHKLNDINSSAATSPKVPVGESFAPSLSPQTHARNAEVDAIATKKITEGNPKGRVLFAFRAKLPSHESVSHPPFNNLEGFIQFVKASAADVRYQTISAEWRKHLKELHALFQERFQTQLKQLRD